jgi:hypothetical protein
MKHTYEITSSFNGTISTGEFQNEKPLFSIKEIVDTEIEFTSEELIERQKNLFRICREQFKIAEQQSLAERIQRERQDIRIYEYNKELYPSVTSIINWDADWFIDKFELAQYAARGSVIDEQVNHYIETGEWVDAKELPNCFPHLVILKKGNLNLPYDDIDFLGFLEKYPIKFVDSQQTVVNVDLRYMGKYDFKGYPIVIEENKEKKIKANGWGKLGIKPELTLFELKAVTAIKESEYFMQGTAYWNTPTNKDVKQFILIHLNKNTQQGFSVPKVLLEKEKYMPLFKSKRENFKKRFQL